jgi:hypothetical protein
MNDQGKRPIKAFVSKITAKELKKLAIDEEMNVPDLVGKLLDGLMEKKIKKTNVSNAD